MRRKRQRAVVPGGGRGRVTAREGPWSLAEEGAGVTRGRGGTGDFSRKFAIFSRPVLLGHRVHLARQRAKRRSGPWSVSAILST